MKTLLYYVLKFSTLFVGIVTTGVLMIPTGALVVLISVIWKTTDKLVTCLEIRKENCL